MGRDAKSDAITSVYPEAAVIPALRIAQTIYNVVSGVGASKADIQFGANENQTTHTFRHVLDQGFDASAVQSAVSSSVGKVAESLPKGGQYTGSVVVKGTTFEYSAFKLPNGTINVGRITPPK